MVVTVALWIDQLFNGFIGVLAILSTLYKVTFTITLVVSLSLTSPESPLIPYE